MNMQMQLTSKLSARKRKQEKNQEMAKTWQVGKLRSETEEAELKEEIKTAQRLAGERLKIRKSNMQVLHEQKMKDIKAFYDDRHEIEKSRRCERNRCWIEQRHNLSQRSKPRMLTRKHVQPNLVMRIKSKKEEGNSNKSDLIR